MSRWPQSLEERFWAKVQKTDTCWHWTASKPKGYGHFFVNGKLTKAHRFSYELANGPIASGMVIDHRCHNTTCVNPDHLRAVTIQQNAENRSGAQANNALGVRGVQWHKASKKFIATVVLHGKRHHVGLFQTVEEAEAAVIAKRNALFTCNDMDRRAA